MKKGSSIALLIIGGLYSWIMLDNGDVCGSHCAFGDSRFFATFLFIPLYIIIFLVSILVSAAKFIVEKKKFNYLPLLTTLVIVSIFYSINFIETNPRFDSPRVLFAESEHDPMTGGSIELKQNMHFTVTVNHGMAYCQFKGNYTLKGDTLHLLRDIYTKTDGAFYNNYIIDKTAQLLYPINNSNNKLVDSVKVFLIKTNSN